MSSEEPRDLVVLVDTPDWIFNAPTINPFAENEPEVLGTLSWRASYASLRVDGT